MKDKIKNPARKLIVEAYQRQTQEAIDSILARDGKLKPSTKNYIEVLKENIKLAPYVLGYLERSEEKKKKKKEE